MSERRMFAKTIIDSDLFLDMPVTTRLLYYDLSMRADDDGFVNNPKKIQRMIGCSEDDIKLLIAKNFLIPFDSGVVVIKHWRVHNYIRNDRYKETIYQDEKALLQTKENKEYELGIPNGNQRYTQVRLGKDSIGKDNIYISHLDLKYVKLTEVQYNKLKKDYPSEDIDNCILLLDEYVTINGNKNKYKDWNLVLRKSIREQWFKKGINTTTKKQGVIPDWYKGYEQELNNPKGQAPKEIQEMAKGLFDD